MKDAARLWKRSSLRGGARTHPSLTFVIYQEKEPLLRRVNVAGSVFDADRFHLMEG